MVSVTSSMLSNHYSFHFISGTAETPPSSHLLSFITPVLCITSVNISSARKLRGEGPTKYPKPAASMDNVEFFSDEFYYPKPERSPCVGMCHRSS